MRRPGPRRSAAAAVVAAVALALLAGPGCTGAREADPDSGFAPGAAGLGDPYFPEHGNGGYQVDHYDLEVRYDPASKQLTGRVTLLATATSNLSGFSLDLDDDLDVRAVAVDEDPATVDREDDELVVTPASGLVAGTRFTTTVAYHGVPEPVDSPQLGSNGFHHTTGGAFAIGQPRSASTWFPVNEHPRDKATYTIELTVPDGLVAVSNGVLEERTPARAPGWTVWRWDERHPMASYLTTVAIGDYRLHETVHRGKPVITAVHAGHPTDVDEQLARTGEIADVLAGWFGPYPFDAYGGIVLADHRIGFALETQSRPVYGPGFFAGGRDGTEVIVHELAHQWFGNSVSVRQWNDIWLNEGFATYAEWLWGEQEGGDTAQEVFDLHWEGPGAEARFWSLPPGDPGATQMFDRRVYDRGAMTLHALRLTVGDDAFFRILRAWAAQTRGGNATTAELVSLSERISGRPLGWLFDQWLYATSRPDRNQP